MATQKSKWTNSSFSPVQVLNHTTELNLERFTSEDLDPIAGCDDVQALCLRSSKTAEPVDLARIAHISSLTTLQLDRVKFTNLAALRALPRLRTLYIDNCRFSDFSALNGFQTLTDLTLRNNKKAMFPAGLDLPQLQSLHLSRSGITDLAFVDGYARSYPGMVKLDLSGNQLSDLSHLVACTQVTELNLSFNEISDLSPLAACPQIVKLNVAYNPISSLAPLAGRKFVDFHASAPQLEERLALKLDLRPPPQEHQPENLEAWRLAALMQAKNWPAVYAVTDLDLLARGFSSFVGGHYDEEALRGVLAHPAEGAFHTLVANGLRPHYTEEWAVLIEVLSSLGERTIAPMTECFHKALAFHPYRQEFLAGKLKSDHATIMNVLLQVASPAYTDLFLAFFNDRNQFSNAHLGNYKCLLEVVGKTKAPQLVEPIMDLLRLERHIVGGDAVFMKRIFKAIGQLGSKADAAVLASRFDAAAEDRPDVLQAYEAALARLEKKTV
ncbi:MULTISPECIES: leucine-rich repeat domain-containing protein [unclassified Acidovorax]|uniref:leucine-rich repeat domain-containing protein n=1 Tax=unclassified Acidovorax TaxID=2684926 RepID=UPI00138F5FD5|nr:MULTISPECIES: leucine-rich repeat domain-containing protein [unclassified Acidovorax]